MTTRISQLEKFIQEDPNDPFPKYALAIEHLKVNKKKSRELFDELLKNHPEYIATYYHAAALYAEFGKRAQAEAIYQLGIAKAGEIQETHALKELQSAYLNFQLED